MKYYIIAGEASGDLHGSNLMKALYNRDKEADIRFWGGSLMNQVYKEYQSGNGMVEDYKDGAIIGFSQVFSQIKKFRNKLKHCKSDINSYKPDVVILIDYPGFNFRIAEFAHKSGYKVFYYIAPKVWASREGRIKKLRDFVDKLYIVFPFEKAYFDDKNIDYIYKGNPILDAIDNYSDLQLTRKDFLSENCLEDKKIIAILPGSRKGEIKSMLPICSEFAKKFHFLEKYSDYQFIIAAAPGTNRNDYSSYIKGQEDYIHIVFNHTASTLKFAEAAVINSGTASLEASIIGVPQVVCYATSMFNYMIFKKIIKIKYISLSNLILDKRVFKELIQMYFNPNNLVDEVRRLIEDSEYRENMLKDYSDIKMALGEKGVSYEIANSMIEYIRN